MSEVYALYPSKSGQMNKHVVKHKHIEVVGSHTFKLSLVRAIVVQSLNSAFPVLYSIWVHTDSAVKVLTTILGFHHRLSTAQQEKIKRGGCHQ